MAEVDAATLARRLARFSSTRSVGQIKIDVLGPHTRRIIEKVERTLVVKRKSPLSTPETPATTPKFSSPESSPFSSTSVIEARNIDFSPNSPAPINIKKKLLTQLPVVKTSGVVKLTSTADPIPAISPNATPTQTITPRKPSGLVKQVVSLSHIRSEKVSFEVDKMESPIIGTSQSLTKEYLRLTKAPDASSIRPQRVLEQSLELVKSQWEDGAEYAAVKEQLKSIRQDITVQHLENKFVVEVYETHSRIALQEGDLDEFQQCHTRLMELYVKFPWLPNEMEFVAYGLVLSCVRRRKDGSTDIGAESIILELSHSERRHPCIAHAILVRLAVFTQDFNSFFRLYGSAPNMMAYLMDYQINKMRELALLAFCSSFRPSFPIDFVVRTLKFISAKLARTFLAAQSAVLSPDGENVLADETRAVLSTAKADVAQSAIPDDEDMDEGPTSWLDLLHGLSTNSLAKSKKTTAIKSLQVTNKKPKKKKASKLITVKPQ